MSASELVLHHKMLLIRFAALHLLRNAEGPYGVLLMLSTPGHPDHYSGLAGFLDWRGIADSVPSKLLVGFHDVRTSPDFPRFDLQSRFWIPFLVGAFENVRNIITLRFCCADAFIIMPPPKPARKRSLFLRTAATADRCFWKNST
ncbi:hypothetical protein Y032_0045g1275 [Ancylostoma ceylanicum]|uniref:Uncharacterized protein n=2 Tax=Ancylostoma ceylanicum TaxID=53326 RepID=A0A016UDY3_9BILA|nr:hypothetical protein Y032_0045g1275 [Ancylostoma ceylanicum]